MDLKKLKEDVYKVPLNKLEPNTYHDLETGCGCIIGHLGLLNGLDPDDLQMATYGGSARRELLNKIRETYGLPADELISLIEERFDSRFEKSGPPASHDELCQLVACAIREAREFDDIWT